MSQVLVFTITAVVGYPCMSAVCGPDRSLRRARQFTDLAGEGSTVAREVKKREGNDIYKHCGGGGYAPKT